jgi:hypothetical protein
MRFSDLLGGPDDEGSASPAGTEDLAEPAPAGASGSLGAPPEIPEGDDELARWFAPEGDAPAGGTFGGVPTAAEPPAQPLAAGTGTTGVDEPAGPSDPPVPAAATGVGRDDLMPARPAHHGRRRR